MIIKGTLKRQTSAIDAKMKQEFEKRYPGWQYVRLEDNTLLFVPPNKNLTLIEKDDEI